MNEQYKKQGLSQETETFIIYKYYFFMFYVKTFVKAKIIYLSLIHI